MYTYIFKVSMQSISTGRMKGWRVFCDKRGGFFIIIKKKILSIMGKVQGMAAFSLPSKSLKKLLIKKVLRKCKYKSCNWIVYSLLQFHCISFVLKVLYFWSHFIINVNDNFTTPTPSSPIENPAYAHALKHLFSLSV